MGDGVHREAHGDIRIGLGEAGGGGNFCLHGPPRGPEVQHDRTSAAAELNRLSVQGFDLKVRCFVGYLLWLKPLDSEEHQDAKRERHQPIFIIRFMVEP